MNKLKLLSKQNCIMHQLDIICKLSTTNAYQ